jgi:hypothetical protein
MPIATGGVPDSGHPIFLWVNTMLGDVKHALWHVPYIALKTPAALAFRDLLLVESPLRFGCFSTAVHCRGVPHAADELSPRNLGCVLSGIKRLVVPKSTDTMAGFANPFCEISDACGLSACRPG